MSTKELLICDNCGREDEKDRVRGWIRVECVGFDFSTMSDPPLPADLCTKTCVIKHLRLETCIVGEG